MGSTALRIEHVGSTSVPGLSAKPVIDIQISVTDLHPLDPHVSTLQPIGYVHVSLPQPEDPTMEPADAVYPFFQKPPSHPSTHHIHLCTAGSTEERNHIVFRDYLRDHPERQAAYLALKQQLAGNHDGATLASREQYSLGKSEFVAATIGDALAAGYSA